MPGGYGAPMPAGAPPKKSNTGVIIAIAGVAVLLLLVIGGGVALWALGYIGGDRKTSIAHEHLPSSCQAVGRIDIKGLLAVPAIKTHVIPALDEKAKESGEAAKFAQFLLTAGLDPKKDLTEAAFCVENVEAATPSFVAVIGGDLKVGGILDALEKHTKKGKLKPTRTVDGLRVIEAADEPVFITQASDAALIVSNNLDLLKKAAKTSDDYKSKYQLPLTEQAVAIVMPGVAASLSQKAGKENPLQGIDQAGRILFSASLDTGKVSGRVGMPDAGKAKEVADGLNQLVNMLNSLPGGGPASDPMAGQALKTLSIRAEAAELVVGLTIPQEAIDKAAKEMAAQIRRADQEI
jgi:hypothetical protein